MDNRLFITNDDAYKYLSNDEPIIDILVDAANEFLDNYILKEVEPNSIIKLAAIKIINYWSKLSDGLKRISDVDVSMEFTGKSEYDSIPNEVIAMLTPYADPEYKTGNSFKFL